MGFFDEALEKAKETMDIVGKKTGEFANVQKLRFDISTMENKLQKDFAQLGKLCYEAFKGTDAFSSEMQSIAKEIENKNAKINQLNMELASIKNRKFCPKCQAILDNDAKFCRNCGEQVIFDSQEQ